MFAPANAHGNRSSPELDGPMSDELRLSLRYCGAIFITKRSVPEVWRLVNGDQALFFGALPEAVHSLSNEAT